MLVELDKEKLNLEFDIKYATEDNFTGGKIYQNPHVFLHEEALEKFKLSCEYAAKLGLRFKIFDAFRPSEAQYKLWDHTPDPDFLADPKRGSPHSRGVAIDLTLIDKNGKELEMGTKFDEFSPKSYHNNSEISNEAKKNRTILLGIMMYSGWDFYKHEWWHYQLFNSKQYKVLKNTDAPKKIM